MMTSLEVVEMRRPLDTAPPVRARQLLRHRAAARDGRLVRSRRERVGAALRLCLALWTRRRLAQGHLATSLHSAT